MKIMIGALTMLCLSTACGLAVAMCDTLVFAPCRAGAYKPKSVNFFANAKGAQ
jgi:hypothetical protein